jgi:hypothetical protein
MMSSSIVPRADTQGRGRPDSSSMTKTIRSALTVPSRSIAPASWRASCEAPKLSIGCSIAKISIDGRDGSE